jgi:hypothetical protein
MNKNDATLKPTDIAACFGILVLCVLVVVGSAYGLSWLIDLLGLERL